MTRQQFQTTFILSFVFIFGTFSCRQTLNKQAQINRADSLRQDFTFFRNILQDNYPSLYHYADKVKINNLFDSCFASINDNTTEAIFFKSLKFIFSSLEDGHLYCGPSPQLRKYYDQKAKFFPLRLYFQGDKTFILSSANDSLSAGTEVISLDNKSINQIRTELFKYIVSDGSIETKKYHILNNTFYFYYLMVYGEQPKFDLTYKSATGELKTIKINAVFKKDIPQFNNNNEHKNLLSLSFSGNVALLTIKTFDSSELNKNNIDFHSFLETSFKKINHKKVNKLIIDLRGNGGGRDLYGSLLYSFLTNKEFNYYKSLTTLTSILPYDQFKSSVSSYNNLTTSMLENIDNKYFRLKKEAHNNLQLIQPNKNDFNGKVWFLTDGLSFSTTAEFCAIAKSNDRGKFIGEETGGAYYGNTSGIQIDTILPNTKISISTGTTMYKMAVAKTKFNDRGIIPDYVVIPTINDIINKQDVQLDYALKLTTEE